MPETDLLPQLQAYLIRAYPERKNIHASNLACLNTGWESDVYGFAMQWNAGQREDLILRIYSGADAYEKSGREYQALDNLLQAGYPVPRVYRLERDAPPWQRPFLIMERIQGHSMWGDLFRHPDEAVRNALMAQFCRLFARLHALDWRPFFPESRNKTPEGISNEMFASFTAVFNTMPLPGMRAGFDWLFENKNKAAGSRLTLIHWDFHPENILLLDDPASTGQARVIDWTGLQVGDPRLDLAWTRLLIGSYEGPQWREVILREYERQAGHVVVDMPFFDAVAAFRRLYSVLVSIAYGAEKLGMRPGAENVMRQQTASLRRVYELWLEQTGLPIAEAEEFFKSV